MHAIFVGPPGTGKTTIARTYGRVLAAVGLLPSGHVVETDRSGLVAEHIGGTGQKTRAKIAQAEGGVLFVDEAYGLSPEGATGQDFGREAVESILKAMEDNRTSLCVIVAGYEAEMDRFLGSNPGFQSRFARTVTFPHYSGGALVQIAESMARAADYRRAEGAVALLGQAFARLAAAPPRGWANARSVRGVLDASISAQADRLSAAAGTALTSESMTTLTEDDLRGALLARYPQAV